MLKFWKYIPVSLSYAIGIPLVTYWIRNYCNLKDIGTTIVTGSALLIILLCIQIIRSVIENHIENEINNKLWKEHIERYKPKPRGQVISDADPYGEEDWTS